jgi:hypothetical protein
LALNSKTQSSNSTKTEERPPLYYFLIDIVKSSSTGSLTTQIERIQTLSSWITEVFWPTNESKFGIDKEKFLKHINFTGDGFFIILGDPPRDDFENTPFNLAKHILLKVKEHNKGKKEENQLKVRIAINYGTAAVDSLPWWEDPAHQNKSTALYWSQQLIRPSRFIEDAQPNQILITDNAKTRFDEYDKQTKVKGWDLLNVGVRIYKGQIAQQIYSLYGKDGEVEFGERKIPPNKIFRDEKLYFDTDKLLEPFKSFFIKRNNVSLHKIKNLIDRREKLTYDEVKDVIEELFRYEKLVEYSGTTDDPYDFSYERDYYFQLHTAMIRRRDESGDRKEDGLGRPKRQCRIVVCTEEKLKKIHLTPDKIRKVDEMISKHKTHNITLKYLEYEKAEQIRVDWNYKGFDGKGLDGEHKIWSSNIGLFFDLALVQFGVTTREGDEKEIGNRQTQISHCDTDTYKTAVKMFDEWFNSSKPFEDKWDEICKTCSRI